jgi:HK97 family phage major capsid protein
MAVTVSRTPANKPRSTMPGPPVSSELLESRRAQLLRRTEQQLLNARAAGRETLLPAESATYRRSVDELRELDQEIGRVSQINQSLARFGVGDSPTPSRETAMRSTAIRDDHLVYRRHDRKTSWIRDLILHQTGQDDSGECRQRLFRHADEVRQDPAYLEYRDLSRTDGQGGYAVPPAWLMDQYVELARPGRAFANLVQQLPLPGGTDSINIPKVLTGTAVGVQTADNQAVTDVDLTDTFINAPVRTIAGQEGVSIQLIDQSPIAFDDVIFRDLVAAYAGVLDTQVLYGSGASGQVLGVDYTPGISSIAVSEVSVQGIYSAIANAIQLVHTTRFQPPEVIVMHPRRWGFLLS